MEIKVTASAFLIAIVILFLVISLKNQYAAMFPILFLYSITSIALLAFNYLGCRLMGINLNTVYPVSIVFSLFVFVGLLAWTSGNTLSETIKVLFIRRKNIVSMIDPLILGNIIVYIMLLKRLAFLK